MMLNVHISNTVFLAIDYPWPLAAFTMKGGPAGYMHVVNLMNAVTWQQNCSGGITIHMTGGFYYRSFWELFVCFPHFFHLGEWCSMFLIAQFETGDWPLGDWISLCHVSAVLERVNLCSRIITEWSRIFPDFFFVLILLKLRCLPRFGIETSQLQGGKLLIILCFQIFVPPLMGKHPTLLGLGPALFIPAITWLDGENGFSSESWVSFSFFQNEKHLKKHHHLFGMSINFGLLKLEFSPIFSDLCQIRLPPLPRGHANQEPPRGREPGERAHLARHAARFASKFGSSFSIGLRNKWTRKWVYFLFTFWITKVKVDLYG